MEKVMKKVIALILMLVVCIGMFSSCRQAERVSYNVSLQADNFNVLRRIAVVNARTDTPMFELVGYFALSNSGSKELEITCQTGQNEYKKHYVYLNEWTLYVVEDLSGAKVDPYHYEINYLPEMIAPFTVTSSY